MTASYVEVCVPFEDSKVVVKSFLTFSFFELHEKKREVRKIRIDKVFKFMLKMDYV